MLIFRRPAILVLCVLAALTLSRLILISLHWGRVAQTDGLMFILLQGVRFDMILIGILFGPVFLLRPWLHAGTSGRRAGLAILNVYTGLATSLAFFVEASSTSFIEEFDSRPNYLFVEYLSYPREVFATLAGSHLLALLAFTGIAVLVAWFLIRWLRSDPSNGLVVPMKFCLLITPITMVLVFLMIRSTLDHRPVNPSIAAFSQDAMVNQLPLNSPYTLLYAIYEHRRDSKRQSVRYGSMDDDEALAIILEEAGITAEDQLDPSIPTLHHQNASRQYDKPLNLVIILEESLGAEFVGSLGGSDLTPRLDEMADQGIWMEQLYATGTRSARGIEAVLSGFTPTPLNSVIKLAQTQSNFFTLAGLLQSHDYQTSFIYGGEAHFDNMKRFFLNNGFQTVIDEKDYENPEFVPPGACRMKTCSTMLMKCLIKPGSSRFSAWFSLPATISPLRFRKTASALNLARMDREKLRLNTRIMPWASIWTRPACPATGKTRSFWSLPTTIHACLAITWFPLNASIFRASSSAVRLNPGALRV